MKRIFSTQKGEQSDWLIGALLLGFLAIFPLLMFLSQINGASPNDDPFASVTEETASAFTPATSEDVTSDFAQKKQKSTYQYAPRSRMVVVPVQAENDVETLLDTRISVDLNPSSYSEAIDYLHDHFGLNNSFIDNRRIEEAVRGYPRGEAHFHFTDLPMRDILELICDIWGLAYYVDGETVFITTKEYANQQFEVRVYDVRPLPPEYSAEALKEMVNKGELSGVSSVASASLTMLGHFAEHNIELIQKFIEPEKWDMEYQISHGMPGKICVRAPYQTQRKVKAFLEELKKP